LKEFGLEILVVCGAAKASKFQLSHPEEEFEN
jgi:hypothetical protein